MKVSKNNMNIKNCIKYFIFDLLCGFIMLYIMWSNSEMTIKIVSGCAWILFSFFVVKDGARLMNVISKQGEEVKHES